MSVRRTAASVAVLSMAVLPLAACSSDGDAADSSQSQTTSSVQTPTAQSTESSSESVAPETTSSQETSTEETTSSSAEETEESTAAETTESADDETSSSAADETTDKKAGSGDVGKAPAWAYPVETPGTKIGTVKNDSVRVDVYQVKVTKSTKNSMLVDAKTKKPLIKKGDKIVWVNYVITNIGKKPIKLASLLVDISAKYPDWQYLSGMASITDSAQAEKLGIHTFALKPNSGVDKPYTFAPGETYTVGENFLYEGPKELDIKVSVTPADAKGDLDHDKKTEFEGKVKIK